MEIRWVIQNNLIAEREINLMRESCLKHNIEIEEVFVSPMVKTMPAFTLDDKLNVYYGSTTFMYNLHEQLNPKGLFYDDETFSMENYLNKWGEYMLNSEAEILTVGEFFEVEKPEEENIFIRPDSDSKLFDGQVAKFKNAKAFLQRHLEYDNRMTLNTKILIGPAYDIFKEWRNYVIDGKVVTSSLYRKNFKLKKCGEDIPQSMLDFVEARLSEYKPHDNFAIDIASTHDGEYYIIECGCLNSVGFYHSDIDKIVEAVTKYMKK
jgi:hypothetical protein